MTPERWRQISVIFQSASELDGAARLAYLRRACGTDVSLLRDLESLLTRQLHPIGVLDEPLPAIADKLGEAVEPPPIEPLESLLLRTIGRYQVLSLIGQGGMGAVYQAVDLNLGRKVALKLVATGNGARRGGPTLRHIRRFQREARAASALNHPNIVTVHDIGETDGLRFIATEFIQGATLREKMRGRLPLREALDIAIQVATALAAAHAAGIIHRDIKPENVMVRDDGLVKMLDFGIAQLTEERAFDLPAAEDPENVPGAALNVAAAEDAREPREEHAQASSVAGTLAYMSPEQARGEALDARTDLFSLGVVLYEMIAGHLPFESAIPSTALSPALGPLRLPALLDDRPAPSVDASRPNVPGALTEILQRALAKSRDDRCQSAAALLTDLKHAKAVVESRWRADPDARRAAAGGQPYAKLSWRRRRWSALARRFARLSGDRHINGGVEAQAAFRGLASFEETDRDQFYGRDADIAALLDIMTRPDLRLGVLFGESGSGKTSVLTAGLVPRLKASGYAALLCRSFANPLATIVAECARLSQETPSDGDTPDRAIEALRRTTEAIGKPLVVICDQFEEFFVNFRRRAERDRFTSFVAACYRDDRLPVTFLFAIRSDFLYLISTEFDGRIPEPLMGDRRYCLRQFDEEQAEEIILKSARHAGLQLEPALCRAVARDLAVDDVVVPSELQIVGHQLQEKTILTVADYQKAGGKEQVVYQFLDEVIRAAPHQDAARLVLRSLISDSDTRLTLTLPQIARSTQRSEETVGRILNVFAKARVVRVLRDEQPWRYELMHEYLIGSINLVTGRVMDARQRANRLLRQYVSSYAVDPRTRIPLRRLWSIRRHADMTAALDQSARVQELLQKSLRAGLTKATAAALALALVTVGGAAAMSVTDTWDGVRLREGHSAGVRRAIFSPDGRRLVSVGEDHRVIVWDVARRKPLATLTDHTDVVTSVAFSPDGRWFATGSMDRSAIIWDAATLAKIICLREHRSGVSAVAVSRDGRLVAAASASAGVGSREHPERVIVWNVGSWTKAAELPDGTSYGNLVFSPDASKLLMQFHVWDLTTGTREPDRLCANWLALAPGGRRLASTCSGGEVEFWDADGLWNGDPLRLLKGIDKTHKDSGRSVAFSPDGRLLASGADDIVLWDAVTQTKITHLTYPSIVWSLDFSPDGRWLVSTHGDGAILLWDVEERQLAGSFSEHSGPVRAVAFSANGKRLAAASEDRSVIVWNTETGKKEATLVGPDALDAVDISPDGRWIAWGGFRAQLVRWGVENDRPTWIGDEKGSHRVAISPDARWIATRAAVYDSGSGRRVSDYLPCGAGYGLAFSADSRRLACINDDPGAVNVFDTATWTLIEHLSVPNSSLIAIAFAPDGTRLVTGDDEGRVRLWSVQPLRELGVIGTHSARIKSVAFAPDDHHVASAGDDRTIALWDVNSRKLLTRIGTHTAPVLAVAFSPDGRRLASGEHDNAVRLYTRHRMLWGRRLD